MLYFFPWVAEVTGVNLHCWFIARHTFISKVTLISSVVVLLKPSSRASVYNFSGLQESSSIWVFFGFSCIVLRFAIPSLVWICASLQGGLSLWNPSDEWRSCCWFGLSLWYYIPFYVKIAEKMLTHVCTFWNAMLKEHEKKKNWVFTGLCCNLIGSWLK